MSYKKEFGYGYGITTKELSEILDKPMSISKEDARVCLDKSTSSEERRKIIRRICSNK